MGRHELKISSEHFGTTPEGEAISLFTLINDHGLRLKITDYGGAIVSLEVPDRDLNAGDVVLGYETLDEYVRHEHFLGALIGRYANRIAFGKFSLDGVAYQLPLNNGPNHLHGGIRGFHKVVWTAETKDGPDELLVRLSRNSPDGEESYPGELEVQVNYVLYRDNELRIEYNAKAARDTIVNLTNHSYFNLAGTGNILSHEVMIAADQFTPVNAGLIPTGELQNVTDTPMDFRRSVQVGKRIHEPFPQLEFAGGYDHNFVLTPMPGLRLATRVRDASSGRVLEVLTTQPGIQFYSGNFLDGSLVGKHGVRYEKYAGMCLETQHFPDSPNHPNFPSTILRAHEQYQEVTVFRFSVE